MMLMIGPMGADVKSAFYLYDMMHSSCFNQILFICSTKSLVLWTWCGDFPTRGFRILASSFAVSYETSTLLETMGLSGTHA